MIAGDAVGAATVTTAAFENGSFVTVPAEAAAATRTMRHAFNGRLTERHPLRLTGDVTVSGQS